MMAIDTFPQAALDPSRTTGLILCGMGGPDRPEAVQPFLRNLFADPLIFPVPRLFAGYRRAVHRLEKSARGAQALRHDQP